MSLGTVYCSVEKGEPLRTRAITPAGLIKYYKLDYSIGEPDEHFPEEFPAKLVPSFRYASGRILTESIPIAFMLAEQVPKKEGLLGDGSEADKARVLAWANTLNLELMNSVANQFTMLVGRQPYNRTIYELAGANIERQLLILNSHLTKNTYLVGERVTLADLYGIPMLLRGLQHLWGPEFRSRYPAVIRWYNTVSRSPVFGGFFESVEFTEISKKPAQH